MDFLEEEFDEILNIFQIESEEIVSRLNRSLLALEKKPNDKDAILMFFRDAHSLKGASRLIGFNSVQTIAHKIEDILGMAKEGSLQFNPKIVDVLYKTVDFMSDLMQKSIIKKREVYSDEIPEMLEALETVKTLVDFEDAKKNQSDYDADLLSKSIVEINIHIAQSLFLLMKIEVSKNDSLINEFLREVKILFDIFSQIGFFDIKQKFEDIIVKLQFVINASGNLTVSEVEQFQEIFDQIITELIPICELYDLEIVDYYSIAFEKMSNKQELNIEPVLAFQEDIESHVEIIQQVSSENYEMPIKEEVKLTCSPDDLDCLLVNFNLLFNDYELLPQIKDFLLSFDSRCSNKSVLSVIKKTLNIFEYAENNQIKLDEDTISALIQGLEYCNEILKNNKEDADVEMILQRLSVVLQLLEMGNDKAVEEISIPQKGYKLRSKILSGVTSPLDSDEIKTLRVDSVKLDVLATQIEELMVSKIKSKKHINELNGINNALQDWQKGALKVQGHLKYYNKKYFSGTDANENPLSFFLKQMLTLLAENNKKFTETVSSISSLTRTIQDDNTKTNLIVDDLEHMVKNIRVLPFATVFHIFGRMVRDIAHEKGKKIALEVLGSDTSADKKIIEEIKSPLIHIIRNSIDHGIETPEDRVELGKDPVGKIVLRARALENKVIIEIEDDGKGINIEKIKKKALQSGYLTQDEINSMSAEQLTNLIFAPGFSTGDEITNISGRGIGLDVVQTKILQLNGKVRVISEINKGCCVQIELPTTMSTVQSFLVQASGQTFAVPLNYINTVVLKQTDEIFSNQGYRTIMFGDINIPLYDLKDILHLPKTPETKVKRETVLIIESDNKVIGLCVDKLLGDQEILQKKLSAPLYKLKKISGVTTLVSGEICLILNMTNILKSLSAMSVPMFQPRTQAYLPINNSDYKILIVDDSITTRTMEKNILSKANYSVDTATDPIQAFEKLKFTRYNLIISDVEMPEMNGFEFLAKLKSDEMYFDIPVIMVSSIFTEANKRQAKDLGALTYIVKSDFNQDEFLNSVQEAINR